VTAVVAFVFGLTALVSAAFAAQELRLLLAFLAQRPVVPRAGAPLAPLAREAPFITVQVALYNEALTAARVIDAVTRLRYPAGRWEVQILDDSHDETTRIVDDAVARAIARGVDVSVRRRTRRAGYKAGALADGLRFARGELVAMFDADFEPEPGFLEELVLRERAFDDPNVGFVQGRWSFKNRDASAFTRAQAILHERHFVLQKPVRERLGLVTTFNGSGGVWRRDAIEASGGWESDTLTEDLDLSYRASLAGFRGHYVPSVAAPSELPADVRAFKLQQRRWARGSAQTLKKLAWTVFHGTPRARDAADEVLYLAGYVVHLALLAQLLVWPWVALVLRDHPLFWPGQIVLALASLVSPAGFLLAARERRGRLTLGDALDVLRAVLLGAGLLVSNGAAVLEGLFLARTGAFVRTPKLGDDVAGAARLGYHVPLGRTLVVELAVVVYCAASALELARRGLLAYIGPCLVWGGAVLAVTAMELRRGVRPPRTPP